MEPIEASYSLPAAGDRASVRSNNSHLFNNNRASARQDVPSEFLPPKPPKPVHVSQGVFVENGVDDGARRPLSIPNRASARVSVESPFATVSAIAVASPDDPSAEAATPTEIYFIDSNTGKTMVNKSTVHNGRAAEVLMEVSPEGQVMSVVGGTARLPGETDRQYFRQMSSFARWQLHDAPGTTGISWQGDQKYPYFCFFVIIITAAVLCAEIGVNGGEFVVRYR